MRIGFYAPLKSPNHKIPSGDRVMARLFVSVLETLGHEIELISELRSWNGTGDNEAQKIIQAQADSEVRRLQKTYSKQPQPDLIFTYHVYHKAPDWIGVEMAEYLAVPYIVAEASYAPKQKNGPWHRGHQQTLKCIQAAKTIISLNPIDNECIHPLLGTDQSIEQIKPFLESVTDCTEYENIDKQQLAKQYNLDANECWLITVAMMRKGDKQTSYQQLAQALINLNAQNWHLLVIGDGTASEQIKKYFCHINHSCTFLGKLDQQSIFKWLCVSDVFVWPAVNEAYGLALLEAQSFGLPVVAQNYGAVKSIVAHNETGLVTNPDSPKEFKNGIEQLIGDKKLRLKLSENSRQKFLKEHSFDAACKRIKQIVSRATE